MTNPYPVLHLEHAWQLAYAWVCQRRRHYPANADIWYLRFHWSAQSRAFLESVLAGRYCLSAMQLVGKHAIWSAQDARVLKWVALQSAPWLPLHTRCEHGLGMGVKASKRRLHSFLTEAQGDYPFVMCTDIWGYYQHIDKDQVLARVVRQLPSLVWRDLIRQYLYYSLEQGREFHTPTFGIGRDCALSPLIGTSLLYHIDADFAGQPDLYYDRYMDDFIILARTRWRLRRAMPLPPCAVIWPREAFHCTRTRLGLASWPKESMGGWFNPQGLVGIALRSLQQYRIRSLRLYEQALRQGHSEEECQARVRMYRQRWGSSPLAEMSLRKTEPNPEY